jgi:DNA polymerase III delta subunit
MVIFLYGPDDYRRAEKKKEIIAEFIKKRSTLGVGLFDLQEKNAIDNLSGFLGNQSIFEKAKLAVLENAFEIPANELANIVKPRVDENDIKILMSEREKPLKALGFLIEKPVLSQKFETLSGLDFVAFAKAEAKKTGITLADPAVQFLCNVYQGNSWGLVTELQKLSTLRAKIDIKDLDAMDLEAAPNYWALLNGLKSPEIKSRLYALEKLLAINDPAVKIFNIVAAQVAQKNPHMAEYDLAVKSGKLDYDEVLVDYAITS